MAEHSATGGCRCHLTPDSVDALRAVLDRFAVGDRLRHIREFVWRGGELQFHAEPNRSLVDLDAAYVLAAQWPAPRFERAPIHAGSDLVHLGQSVVDGRWVRATSGYQLRVGIHVAVPSAIYIRSAGFSSHVPIARRSDADVEHGLHTELAAYVERFLDRCESVPNAIARDREALTRLFVPQEDR